MPASHTQIAGIADIAVIGKPRDCEFETLNPALRMLRGVRLLHNR